MFNPLINKIIDFSMKDDDIRAVIMEGSMADDLKTDEFSDCDINIFSNKFDRYLNDDEWFNCFGSVRLYQKEEFDFYDSIIPTRLVLFKDGSRIDFSFWHTGLLQEMVERKKVYKSYQNGFQILVDKDKLAAKLKPPVGKGFAICPPDRDEFLQLIYEFWFEAYCVAKYLFRKDLWYAKLIENRYIKDHLYKMVLWNHQSKNGWESNPVMHSEGKRFEQWAPPDLVAAISLCFSGYDWGETWASLFAMLVFFNNLAKQTSRLLNITYPQEVEKDIMDYIDHIKELADGSCQDKKNEKM